MTIDEMIAVLKAAKEGKVIQARSKPTNVWGDVTGPCWAFDDFDYRVKPAPREVLILEVTTRPKEGSVWSATITTPEQWERLTPEDQAKWTRFVEAEQ